MFACFCGGILEGALVAALLGGAAGIGGKVLAGGVVVAAAGLAFGIRWRHRCRHHKVCHCHVSEPTVKG